MSNVAIGIDLGTTFCSVGTFKDRRLDIIAFIEGDRALPSHVYFSPDSDEIIVGSAAKYTIKSIGHAVYDSKRFIGAKFTDKCVQDDLRHWPFKVIDDNGDPKIEIEYNKNICHFSPEEISSFILKEIKKVGDLYIGKDVNTKTKAVVTVPAYFSIHQRECTKRAAESAGLEVIKILNEPTAAAIAYSYQRLETNKVSPSKRTILIYDFGGGTFDVSIIELDEINKKVRVIATDGDSHLGGEDIDNLLVDYFLKAYYESIGNNKVIPPRKMIDLRKKCEKAKQLLSSCDEAYVDCEFLEDAEVDGTITDAIFRSLTLDIVKKTIEIVKKVLNDNKIDPSRIDDIVCVGGSSRMPRVEKELSKAFPGTNICKDINSNEVVAQGATIVANFNEFNFKVIDVISHSLSTDITNGEVFVMIPKNSPIPCKHTERFANAEKNQTHIDVNVFEGEGLTVSENRLLGNFTFNNITPSPARTVLINITFNMDDNGILTVTGEEEKGGVVKKLVIKMTN